MDGLNIAGLALAVAQVTAACLKTSRNYVGPSQHSSKHLQELTSNLSSFNEAISNLQTHLEVCAEDQGRLLALANLKEPLEKSMKSVELIKTRLEDPSFVRKHVLGAHFDGKLRSCLKSLKMSRTLFDEVLQMDQRLVSSPAETCIWMYIDILTCMNINCRTIISVAERRVREDLKSMKSNLQSLDDRHQQNHEEMRIWHVKADQQKQGSVSFEILHISVMMTAG